MSIVYCLWSNYIVLIFVEVVYPVGMTEKFIIQIISQNSLNLNRISNKIGTPYTKINIKIQLDFLWWICKVRKKKRSMVPNL